MKSTNIKNTGNPNDDAKNASVLSRLQTVLKKKDLGQSSDTNDPNFAEGEAEKFLLYNEYFLLISAKTQIGIKKHLR